VAGQGGDAARLCDEAVPGVAAARDDGVEIGEEPEREEALAEVEPDPLHRVQLRRAGRQEDQADVGRDGDGVRRVPAGAVEQQGGMDLLWQGLLRQGRGEAVEEGLHRRRADLGDDQGEGRVGAGADGGVEPGGGVAVVDDALGAETALVPDPGAAALLADTGFVLAPEL